MQSFAVFHAVAFALDNNDFAVMQEPVKNSGSYRRVVIKDFRPVFEWFVAGGDYRTAFVALNDHLKKEVAPELVNR